jgi:hypothetical protein
MAEKKGTPLDVVTLRNRELRKLRQKTRPSDPLADLAREYMARAKEQPKDWTLTAGARVLLALWLARDETPPGRRARRFLEDAERGALGYLRAGRRARRRRMGVTGRQTVAGDDWLTTILPSRAGVDRRYAVGILRDVCALVLADPTLDADRIGFGLAIGVPCVFPDLDATLATAAHVLIAKEVTRRRKRNIKLDEDALTVIALKAFDVPHNDAWNRVKTAPGMSKGWESAIRHVVSPRVSKGD